MARRKRPGRLRRWFERIVLGAAMGFGAFLLERRLRKALGGRGRTRRRRTIEIS